ncbi:MAG: LamG domain-containing protein [Armatimonadota bacterium]
MPVSALGAFCALAILLIVIPAEAAGWSKTPLAQWKEAVTVDSCTEAMPPDGPPPIPANHRAAVPVPQPPYGKWKEASGALTATGLTNCWSTMLLPKAQEADGKITLRFTVQSSSKAQRQLPGGCVRWGFHWGENLPGWDAGIVFGYQDPLNFYRLQVSATRGELALWDATGGFLQFIPCKVELGKAHELTLIQHGTHLLASLDGTQVMDYWDRTLPYTKGKVGLAVWKSVTRVEQFQVENLPADPTPLPAHQPNFRFEPTENILNGHPGFHMDPKSGVILFDGYEPISVFWKAPQLFQETVKIKPGYRPPYYTAIGPTMSGVWPPLVGELPAAFKVEGGGETITFKFQTEEPKVARTDYTCTVRYDRTRGVYRYEYRGKLTVTGPKLLNEYEFYDPLTFNNRAPGPEVEHTWNYASHRWHVYQGPGGAWMRYPIVDFLTTYNNQEVNWGKFDDFLYPDPAACPAFETEIGWKQPEGRKFYLGQCTWGYDYHHAEKGRNYTMETGTERPFAFTFTALLPEEGKQRFDASKLPDKFTADHSKLIPFDPRGTTFQQTTTWQDPSATMLWNGTLDTTVGHTDNASLRIDGPGTAGAQLYQHMIEQYAERWWVRGWFKTKGTKGSGLKLKVKYSYGKEAEDNFYLGGLGDREWTYFSFITTALQARDSSDIVFSLDGPGQAWLDEVAISALKPSQRPRLTKFAQPASAKPRADLLIDLPMAEKPDRGVYDVSNNGHALVLKGTTWAQEDGRGFLRFDGVKDVGTIKFTSVLEPREAPAGGEGYRPLFALKQFSYEFWVRPRTPATNRTDQMVVFHSRFNPQVYFDQLAAKPGECRFVYQNNVYQGPEIVLRKPVPYDKWLHVVAAHGNGKVTLYLNGVKAEEASYDPKAHGFINGEWWYSLGGWFYGGRNLTGDLGPFRLHTKALTAEEVTQRAKNGGTSSK